jgi:hypothetical protein
MGLDIQTLVSPICQITTPTLALQAYHLYFQGQYYQ